MKKHIHSVDGFIPRQRASNLGDQHKVAPPNGFKPIERPQLGGTEKARNITAVQRQVGVVSRSEIDESLAGIDQEVPAKPRRKLLRRHRGPKIETKKRRNIKRILKLLVLLGIVFVVISGVRMLISGGRVFQGNILGLLTNQQLKMDENGRSNVLVFGTSEDDPGHQAPYLTDSIMVMSIDQTQKNAYMMSIPRDLWVEYGKACNAGNQGKINEVYGCYSNFGKEDAAGAAALQKKVGSILGMDIQYYAHVNYSVVRDVVKALGTITVDIKGSGGAPGVMDSNFDWKCGPTYAQRMRTCPPNGHFIEYKNGPTVLDAEHALYLAQARGDSVPTYGLARSNFDREINQQKIVKSIREKALSVGTLTNFGKVADLMDAVGNNLRTSFQTGEIRTLAALGQDIPADKITSISFIEEGNELLVGANFSGAVVPAAGTFEYGMVQSFIMKKLSSSPIVREAARVAVLNGTTVTGLAKKEADGLLAKGYTVTTTATMPIQFSETTIYKLKKGYDGTAAALEKYYGTKINVSRPDTSVPADTVFVVVIGSDRAK